ncbi:ATP-binding protein [Streptomyces sp. NPDC056600]|uniref:ATP-binding protein n=1 Tax=Streptomyces sp. NPDC056600 TaxID=3345874 RepID=UPI003674CE32
MIAETPTRERWAQLFSGTPRGARLARLLATRQLELWGWPPSSEAGEAVALVVAELAKDAVTHGHVPGRGFRLRLEVEASEPGLLVVSVDDARGERLPEPRVPEGEDSGRGLLLVQALAVAWGWRPRPTSGKTVWAVCARGGGPSRLREGGVGQRRYGRIHVERTCRLPLCDLP